MHRPLCALMPIILLASSANAAEKPRRITDREPDAVDVAKTPMTDLNISKTEIPALLAEAQKRPYSLQNLQSCREIVAAVSELDAMLGPDIDLPQEQRSRLSEGRIAQWAVGTFIPFRSIIREISGANKQERSVLAAIQAGMTRRGFLKGVGATRNCPYPGSPATETVLARQAAETTAPDPVDQRIPVDPAVASETPKRGSAAPVFTSTPVVQPTR
ncbi:hypothetical protein [uncultured Novosphingobium sp.]|uniref:hypothetical protein n=1 Tax=uncultured Novosphingobium sp. TaxID=292277 RepID=UPI00258D8809|nr:hypothetical protein [uncultured Novosphingobium sp.]